MNAYTVSRLALDAGVSVHIVRDYLLCGLLRPVACTMGGYGLFDERLPTETHKSFTGYLWGSLAVLT